MTKHLLFTIQLGLEGVVEGYTHTVHTANLYAVLHSWLRLS